LSGDNYFFPRIRITTKAPPLQQRLNPLTHERRQEENVLIPGRRQLVKLRTAIAAGCVNPVKRQAMEMGVAIQGISPALHERHGATLRRACPFGKPA